MEAFKMHVLLQLRGFCRGQGCVNIGKLTKVKSLEHIDFHSISAVPAEFGGDVDYPEVSNTTLGQEKGWLLNAQNI